MKRVLSNAGFGVLPAWKPLRVKQKLITPTATPLPQPFAGVHYSLKDSIRSTIERLLPLTVSDSLSRDLTLNIKFGFDGSGSHAIYK